MNLNPETTLNLRIDENTKLVIKQIIVYDQFSETFNSLIKTYSTADHICAYTASANIRILQQYGIQEGLIKLKDMNFVKNFVEDMMKYVFQSRLSYAKQKWNNNIQKIKEYCRDWVANYELSDYMKTLKLENVYIFRHVGLFHKDLFEKTENQERERIIQDETPFKDQPYFIYYPKEDKYIRKDQFTIQDNHLYIFDTMGHFICGWVKNKDKKNKQITILETIPHRDSKTNKNLQIFFI
ncbi:unnamed protein product [Paramecium primaurelia]|uniref:Uncharacterized protein n=1 Tax=Paramecium primaurelia TaxID=5886 RepID=A0A8S1KSL9_PARPR|nr:unnamed protein product [Paramecium primaurelia]